MARARQPAAAPKGSPSPAVGNVRYIGSLNGRYLLSSRDRRLDAQVKVFACRVTSITPHRVVLAAPVIGICGEWATLQVNDLGLLRIEIEDQLEAGFSALIAASEAQRASLARRIGWVKRRALYAWTDQREHHRVMPRVPGSSLLFADGSRLGCFLIDISQSGAAISADIIPPIGTPLAVGRVLARVVRHLDVGFAVQFLELQQVETLEGLLAGVAETALPEPVVPAPGQ